MILALCTKPCPFPRPPHPALPWPRWVAALRVGLLACPVALGAQTSDVHAFAAPWSTVFVDSGFQIGLDTSRVDRLGENHYLIWLQTRWAEPRRGRTKTTPTPFNREMIRTFLHCNPTQYKVIQTVVYLNDGPPIDSVGVGLAAATSGEWTTPSPGSADIRAGDRACAILHGRFRGGPD